MIKENFVDDFSTFKKKLNEQKNLLNEGVRIELIDPRSNEVVKVKIFDGNFKDSEKEVEKLNSKLTTRQKQIGYYWNSTIIY